MDMHDGQHKLSAGRLLDAYSNNTVSVTGLVMMLIITHDADNNNNNNNNNDVRARTRTLTASARVLRVWMGPMYFNDDDCYLS